MTDHHIRHFLVPISGWKTDQYGEQLNFLVYNLGCFCLNDIMRDTFPVDASVLV